MNTSFAQHNFEIQCNVESWNRKLMLHKIRGDIYTELAGWRQRDIEGDILKLGAGISKTKGSIPEWIMSDLSQNPQIERIETAYDLAFNTGALSSIILDAVFHQLEHARTALAEMHRALQPRGRLVIFKPVINLLDRLIYGPLHHEAIGLRKSI